MFKFTKEEINLCKQVAERHRKDISDGDWIYHEPHNNYFLVVQHVILHYQLQTQKWFDELNAEHRKMNIPLWTISDCIFWLYEKGFNHIYHFMQFKNENWSFAAEDRRYKKIRGEGETRLEACLKAVLAVLEEKKK